VFVYLLRGAAVGLMEEQCRAGIEAALYIRRHQHHRRPRRRKQTQAVWAPAAGWEWWGRSMASNCNDGE